ncbi:MAG TPA: exodeoxyribonuclease VII large subunit, partial [Terriglobales bacterium]|nr:exodeoxyribonuclease VII large subunit [Terriglobales bacterium]
LVRVVHRRYPARLLLAPASVQGAEAVAELCRALAALQRVADVEVIVLCRGGGSAEDLSAFNDEALARAIAASQIPVISAVGHETDFTIADFVADLRAPTPSAAAEIVIQSKRELEEQVAGLGQRLGRAARYRLLMARQELTELAQHGAFARMRELIQRRQQRVDEAVFGLQQGFTAGLVEQRRKLEVAAARLRTFDLRRVLSGMRREIEARTAALGAAARAALLERRATAEKLGARLEELSPVKILDRGYALVFDASGALIKDAAQVKAGDEITARVARGTIAATVKKRSP